MYLLLLLALASPADPFAHGEAIELKTIPANERGILCLARDDRGRVYGGTTGRAAHLFVYEPARDEVRSLARLAGGVGFSYGLARLPDGSFIAGTQADPTGTAGRTDPAAVGHLYRFTIGEDKPAHVEDLGVPVAGQGIHALAYLRATDEIAGNTWPDGHFFTYDLKTRRFTDHGAIAGYRPFETPQHAVEVSRGTGRKVTYPRQVSRAIAVDPLSGAYTGGADGFLYRYDFKSRRLEKLTLRLPAALGREPWASLDAAVIYPRNDDENMIVGGTSDGHLFELRIAGPGDYQLRPRGKPLSQGTVQGLVVVAQGEGNSVLGVGGDWDGMPRWFRFSQGGSTSAVLPGGIPHAEGQPSMNGFGALLADGRGSLYAGERDRIGRLVRYRLDGRPGRKGEKSGGAKPQAAEQGGSEPAGKLPCYVVFAPEGATTEGSGYTAIEVGKDGKVYVGAARYGDYAWLLRFDSTARPLFMDKVVSLRQLTGEHRTGINAQGKIHAKIVVGADGKVWFASKQGHEIFDTRPEYGEDRDGYPGGHLCCYDPKTGFSRSVGILLKQEGLLGGVIDDARGKLYYRSEPRNHFLVYDIATGEVQDRGHVGASCRYMAIDRRGAVYTVGRGATLCRYDPETGVVEDLAVKVAGEGGYAPPYLIALGPNGKLYGAGTSHPWIMEFDIEDYRRGGDFPEVTMRNVALAAPAGFPVLDIHAGVFGKNGRFYYPLWTKDHAGEHLRIMSFDPATRKVETVGVPDTSGVDETKVRHVYTRNEKYRLDYIQGAAVGPDGTLYLLDIYPQLNVACFPRLTAPH